MNKLPYEEVKYLYETAYTSAMNALFRDHFDKHGWKYDDFLEEYNSEEELIDFAINPNATFH